MDLTPTKCSDAWRRMSAACAQGPVRNFAETLDMSDFVLETELFPRAALEAYSAWNMEQAVADEQRQHMNAERGGPQGDYRPGMAKKMANVVECLTQFPRSKRAVISISNNPMASHRDDSDAKCVRELHLYLDDGGQLSGTLLLRAQAVSLFPKNIHMVGSIMSEVAARLPGRPTLGTVFYLTTILVADRN